MSEPKKKRNYIQATMLLFALVVLPIGSYLYLQEGLEYFTDRLDEMGDLGTAPDFKLINQDGDTVTVNDLKGKMSVVGYFSSDCGVPCDSFVNAYVKIQEAFPDNYRIAMYTYHTGNSAVDRVDNRKTGSKWYWLKGEREQLDEMFSTGYQIQAENGYANQFALVDSSMVIRRLYDAMDVNEINRLIVHLAMAAPRPPKSEVRFVREDEK